MSSLATAERLKSAATPPRAERAGLDQLYDRFGATAYGLALSITRDPERAEQIVATAFARVWREHDHELGSTTTFFAALMTTVRASAVSNRDPRSQATGFAGTRAAGGPVEGAVADALRDLGATQQQILALAYFGGLAVGDIAARLQLPLSAVKAGLQSALMHVRAKMAPQLTVAR